MRRAFGNANAASHAVRRHDFSFIIRIYYWSTVRACPQACHAGYTFSLFNRSDLGANFDKQKQTLTDNLNKVYADRTAELATIGEPAVTQAMNDLIARGASSDSVATFQTLIADLARINSDPQLAILNSEAQTLEKQIGDLSATQNSFSEDSLGGTPIAVLDPVNTVELPAVDGLRTRDMLLMGGIAGLVVGWLLASALNGAVFSRRDRRKVAASKWEPAKVGGGDG